MSWLWTLFGLICLSLGAIGIVLPLLPTVPFLLLAAFCFAKGSETLHNWLINHKKLGPPIEGWRRNGAISRNAKRYATLSILLVFGISLATGLRPKILLIQGATLCCVLIFIWSRPSGPR
ncbi:YbaN family protein [Pseudooceanicola sp.]|uniref:YbaN family protein n=1 Tax=Pseudooceanicola sp. TaxID=1914328 RepID=UPI002612995A|nr:YbaN family protein [Pseudooceanicola sp.]MDF1854958.1 YbaN family protein [Pseudooceanicola sp.]